MRIKAGFVFYKSLTIGLMPFAALFLSGCGSTGGSAPLHNSASLSPAKEQAGKTAGAKAKVKTADVPIGPLMAKQEEGKTSKTVKTVKVNTPPAPIRKPYRKVRVAKKTLIEKKNKIVAAKKAKTIIKKPEAPIKTVTKPVPPKSGVTKLVVRKAPPEIKQLPAKLPTKPVVVEAVIAKPAATMKSEVPMVPQMVVPVQMPTSPPQDIMDAFDEAEAEARVEPEKMAKARTVSIEPAFEQSDHRFSGQ